MLHALILSAVLALSSFVQSTPAVTFSNINDAVAGKFFSSAATTPDPVAGNVLRIGVESGFDSAIWKYRDFRAVNLAYYNASASDAIAFTATAPAGYVISNVRYEEALFAPTSRTGHATTSTLVTVNGVTAAGLNVPLFAPTRTAVVTITTTLVAGSGDATVSAGRVVVDIIPG